MAEPQVQEIEVTLVVVGSEEALVTATAGATVAQIFEENDVVVQEGFKVEVNNEAATLETVVQPDAVVMVVGALRAGDS